MNYLGDFNVGATVYLYFTTHSKNGGAIAPLSAFEAGDVVLYKNGSATQRSSTSGWTMTSPFDSITGLHLLAIDLSDNTDAGFYAAGSDYTAVLSPDTETIDGEIALGVVGRFSIERLAKVNLTQILGTAVATPNTSGLLDVNTKQAGGTAWGSGAITAASIATDAIGASELAADAVTEIAASILTTALTEAYGADGAAPTLAQAIFLIMQRLTEFAIAGTTITIKKLDGSTTAATLTLDDAANPTSSTRAT